MITTIYTVYMMINKTSKKESEMKKIRMFATANDTDKWAVCVDGFFGLFDDKTAAVKVYNLIGGESNEDLGDTAFGSCQILPPGARMWKVECTNPWNPEDDRISEHRAINIEDYIRKVPVRRSRRSFYQPTTPSERLATKKFFSGFFGEVA